ncbi:MAG: CUAEP/CCAEP-tail radical SAM protein [Microthrixaceae bacterium]
MKVLLVSTYELGHQPVHLASPAAALLRRGHDVHCVDLSVEPWDPAHLDGVEAAALSVPMHTAMRLALRVATTIRDVRPDLPICLYGLYASTGHDMLVGTLVDRVIAGEYEPALIRWVGSIRGPTATLPKDEPEDPDDLEVVHLQRGGFGLPARHLLPPLERYARLSVDGEERLVGSVEASHGCGFSCRHCPVPPVYEGRIRIVGAETVLADIDQLVRAGARHISFGDPDFLNGIQHSRRIVAEMHRRHPRLTFDCTTKVELILRHRGVWPEFAAAGCLFVVSAFETTNDEILRILDKGHTRADMVAAIGLLRGEQIEIRPSLLPFTPWTTVDDLVDLMDFVAAHGLVGNVDPVHYSIRLLVPEDSLLVEQPVMSPFLREYVPERLGYEWRSRDPRLDDLQRRIASLVEAAAASGLPVDTTYAQVRRMVAAAAGREDDGWAPDEDTVAAARSRPRLTEAWFCCAEPTELQMGPLGRTGCGSEAAAGAGAHARPDRYFFDGS